ncbi:MAG: peptidase M24 [Thiotrichales bacterium]|mgnify:CR=1 FL=1|nr:peptidase M24 [Thiotrichales bacterium]
MVSPPDNSLSTLNLDESLIDESRMHRYRLTRIQAELAKRDLAALITYDPVNTRYATGMRNMQVWAFHSVIRMAFIPAEGDVVLFEYAGSEHLSDGLDTVREVRASIPLHFGPGLSHTQSETRLNRWRAEVEDVARETCGNHKRIALDNQVPYIAGQALNAAGFEIAQGYDVLASAQAVKNEDELRAMRRSLEVAELGINKLEQNITPQSTENKLWSLLNQVNVEHGGEYMDTRLLSSGPRTNPWYQECSSRVIQSGDMIALDTDMIGPYGYDADISRSFVCGPDAPTARQREIYRLAYEHIQHNMALLEPGKSFRQLSEQAFRLPERYQAQAISMNWHGVSLYGGWPTILGYGFFDETSEDGEVVPGMTLCVESYVGEVGGPDGVKLEEQVLVTESGVRLLSHYAFDEALLR